MKIAAMKKLFYLGVLLISMSLNAQFFEGFENGAFPPTGWLVTNTGTLDNQVWKRNTIPWPAYEGTYCAFVDRSNFGQGNTLENWLITPAITIGANKALSFYCRQTIGGDVGTLYQVRVSTSSQSDLNSYTTIASWPESNMIPALDYIRIGFPLTAYQGQTVHIAFVKVFEPIHIKTNSKNVIRIKKPWVSQQIDNEKQPLVHLKENDVVELKEDGIYVTYKLNFSKTTTVDPDWEGIFEKFRTHSL